LYLKNFLGKDGGDMVTNRKSWLIVCFVLSLAIILWVVGVVSYLKSIQTINDINGNFVMGIVFLIMSFFSFRMKVFTIELPGKINVPVYSIVCFMIGTVLAIPFFVRFVS
jgi:predicted neutral ceramidase superfamily lipid hydrolase